MREFDKLEPDPESKIQSFTQIPHFQSARNKHGTRQRSLENEISSMKKTQFIKNKTEIVNRKKLKETGKKESGN